MTERFRFIGVLLLVLVALSLSSVGFCADPDETWLSQIRPDHPRLFFNADTWPAVKDRALTVCGDHYAAVKATVKDIPEQPDVKDWGSLCMGAAFVYRVEPTPQRLQQVKDMLQAGLDFYQQRYAECKMINWYSFSRIGWLAALDWIWNDLTPAERRRLGAAMLQHVYDVQPGEGKPSLAGCNTSNYTTGFYGVRNLVWYAGLAMYNEGIDDARALEFLTSGYDMHQKMFAYRTPAAGDDGGSASSTVTYSFAAYPCAEFNFLYTLRSATGIDISGEWPYIALFPNYILWNWLPGGYEYGYGDTPHSSNHFPTSYLYTHMSSTAHFYTHADPQWATLAGAVRKLLADVGAAKHLSVSSAVQPFLMLGLDTVPPAQDLGQLPPARHFENMGQIFMRSGNMPQDTYALFACGAKVHGHRHFDANHFTIFKQGFLALDSGTRIPTTASERCNHYYRQTVAHNCILIQMPDESGNVVGGAPVHDGGQRTLAGSEVIAFETTPHFTYVAGDATDTYHRDKCKQAVRQFVFIPPNHFVVFDRVSSTDPEYAKRWVLHTANEPAVTARQFRADQGQGRIFCRTLLPADAVLQKVGGPGNEFLADGVNYPLRPQDMKDGQVPELMGRWRIEVSPGAPRTDDIFLHLIQVGDQSLQAMSDAQVTTDADTATISFNAEANNVILTFPTSGNITGHITIKRDAEVLMDNALTLEVMPQQGLASLN